MSPWVGTAQWRANYVELGWSLIVVDPLFPSMAWASAELEQDAIPCVVGVPVPIRASVVGTGQADVQLECYAKAPADLLWTFVGRINDPGFNWATCSFGSYTPTASLMNLKFVAADFGPYGPDARSGLFCLDDIVAEATLTELDMAIMLAELPVRAMLALLQTNLSGELIGIVSERADSVALATPTAWYCWFRDEGMPDRCEVEVSEEGTGVDFPNFRTDISRWTTGQRVGLRSSVRIVVGLNHANRGDSAGSVGYRTSLMRVRSWRYAAALLRCIRNTPTLGFPTQIMAFPESVRYSTRQAQDGSANIERVEVTVRCEIQETASGEGAPAGGTPPSATLES
jgi:hypothetical protein